MPKIEYGVPQVHSVYYKALPLIEQRKDGSWIACVDLTIGAEDNVPVRLTHPSSPFSHDYAKGIAHEMARSIYRILATNHEIMEEHVLERIKSLLAPDHE